MLHSGRSPQGLTLDLLEKEGYGPSKPPPITHGHMVTVPGAAAAWCDTVKYFGSGKVGNNLMNLSDDCNSQF